MKQNKIHESYDKILKQIRILKLQKKLLTTYLFAVARAIRKTSFCTVSKSPALLCKYKSVLGWPCLCNMTAA